MGLVVQLQTRPGWTTLPQSIQPSRRAATGWAYAYLCCDTGSVKNMSVETGSRGIYLADKEASLPYKVYDADHHIYAPQDARIRHLDPKYHDRLQQTTGRITSAVERADEEHIATTI